MLSTLRGAADLDYRVIVLSDCVTDTDSEVNRVLLDKVFPPQADVIDSADFIQRLNPCPPLRGIGVSSTRHYRQPRFRPFRVSPVGRDAR
ncbi:MAG: isochorismatase hydrolase family protein [Nocardia sp.]|nr:isochorismatase hydrolase family protein [Nocardia sp.]